MDDIIEFIVELFAETIGEVFFDHFIGDMLLGNSGKPRLKFGIRVIILSVLCLGPAVGCFSISFSNQSEPLIFLGLGFVGLVFVGLYIAGLVKMIKNDKKFPVR